MIDLPTYVLHRSYESALLGAKVETLQSRATRELLRLVARSIHDNFFFFRFYFYCIIKLWYIFHRGLSEAGLLPLCSMFYGRGLRETEPWQWHGEEDADDRSGEEIDALE
jgi:hypothetical protein